MVHQQNLFKLLTAGVWRKLFWLGNWNKQVMDDYLAALPFLANLLTPSLESQIGEKGLYQAPQFIQLGQDRMDFGRIAVLSQNSYIVKQKVCL